MNVRKILLGLIPEKARLDRISRGIAKRHHRHVTEIAQSYLEGIKQRHLSLIELNPKKEDLVGKKIIWQYWGQGIEREKLPAVVQLCFDSVTQYSEEYEVIRLTDTSINEYVDLDHSVWERYIKYKDAGYKAAFFSDVLRVALLSCYGGIWLDATVLMTGSIPQECTSLPFFAYQRDNNQKHRSKWQKRTPTYFGWRKDFKVRFLSSIMFTTPGHIIPHLLYTMLVYYCREYDRLVEYFLLQIFFQAIVEDTVYAQYNSPIVSDCLPHQMIFDVVWERSIDIKEVVASTSLHKLTYITDSDLEYLKQSLAALPSE